MPELQSRLVTEIEDLEEKQKKLDRFWSTDLFDDLSLHAQHLLTTQRDIMIAYRRVLEKRLLLIGAENEKES